MKFLARFCLALVLLLTAAPAFAQPATIPLTTAWPPGRSILYCYNPASSPNYTAGPCGMSGTPVWITPATSSDSTAPVQVSCATSATQAFGADTTAIHREIVNNLATGIVYWGKSSGVTTGTGFPIPPGSAYDFTGYSGPVYCIAAAPITVGTAKW